MWKIHSILLSTHIRLMKGLVWPVAIHGCDPLVSIILQLNSSDQNLSHVCCELDQLQLTVSGQLKDNLILISQKLL